MEIRNVELTLEKAQEWYKKGGDLKEVALQAFTEEELKEQSFKDIKTFEDACYAVMLNPYTEGKLIKQIEEVSKASAAIYKLNIIRKALNKGQEMKFAEGKTWYPHTPFVTKNSTYYKNKINRGELKVVAKFKVNCKKYFLLGGYAHIGDNEGLGAFHSYFGVGTNNTSVGFLGCATQEIAQHMSRYFAKEIFEAKYSDFVNFEWL